MLDTKLEAGLHTVYFGKSSGNKPPLKEDLLGSMRGREGAFSEKMHSLIQDVKHDKKLQEIDEGVKGFIRTHSQFLSHISETLKQSSSKEESLKRARENQTLALDHLILLVNGDAMPAERKNASHLLSFAQHLSEDGNIFGIKALQVLNSARAQAALAHMFHAKEYTVLLPEELEDYDEVETWDLNGGVDFVVVSPDKRKVIFVDAKSRLFTPRFEQDFHGNATSEKLMTPIVRHIAWNGNLDEIKPDKKAPSYPKPINPGQGKHDAIKKQITSYFQEIGDPLRLEVEYSVVALYLPSASDNPVIQTSGTIREVYSSKLLSNL